MSSSARTSQLSPAKCHICSASFARQEHLTRHVRIHTQERPFQCKACGKRFSRQDVLARHISSHEEDAVTPTRVVSDRACKACATGRVRCSREQPCKRCSEKSLACEYPAAKRRRASESPRNRDEPVAGAPSITGGASTAPAVISQANDREGTITTATNHQISMDIDLTSNTNDLSQSQNSHQATQPGWMNTPGAAGLQSTPDDVYELNQPPYGVSCVNWMSPQNTVGIDWDTQMADFSNNYQNYNMGNASFPLFFNSAGPANEGYSTWNPTATERLNDNEQQIRQETTHTPSQSAAESGKSGSTEGRLYVDGTGARAPFRGQSHSRGSNAEDVADLVSSGGLVSAANIDYMCDLMRLECRVQAVDLNPSSLPTAPEIESYVRIYFQKFHPIFPFLRKASFCSDASQQWILLLAVAAIGARYSYSSDRSEPFLSLILQKVLTRMQYGMEPKVDGNTIYIPGDASNATVKPDVRILQAGILNIILMLHSGKQGLVERALTERHCLLEACNGLELLTGSVRDTTNQQPEDVMACWLKSESERRTGMMVFLLDTLVMYEFNKLPLMQLDDVSATLPSRDDLWENPNAGSIEPLMTLGEAVEMLYMEKKLPPHLSEFSSIILINAIYRRTKEAISRERAPLHAWTPTATVQPRPQSRHVSERWPPATPTLSRWRNSACDCLDILHWSANGKAAQRSGLEHHTILYLHLSRLLILTPIAHIQMFASGSSSAQRGAGAPSEQYMSARRHVLQWVVQDQFKARLSIIHCGALFWHVRRYSCDSVIEPFAIYMSTLVLWAYCIFTQFGSAAVETYANQEESSATSPIEETDVEPSFMHLDRPLDDELVQLFVRSGHKISAYVAKVGNINESLAPGRILCEGVRLLARGVVPDAKVEKSADKGDQTKMEYVWGIEASFIESLQRLTRATTDATEAA